MPVAVVAGGAGVLGRHVVSGLLDAGHRVVVLDRDCSGPVTDLPSRLCVDLTREDEVRGAFEETVSRWGVPDVLVNCQGWSPKLANGEAPRDDQLTEQQFTEVIRVNLVSCFLTMREAAPAMAARGTGRVVNVTSTAALTGRSPAVSAYVAAKAGLEALTRQYAVRYGHRGVLVSAVAPGKFAGAEDVEPPSLVAGYLSGIPLGRLAAPSEIAEVILFLASRRNRYITGHTVVVDGGRLA